MAHDVIHGRNKIRFHLVLATANYESSIEFIVDIHSIAFKLVEGDTRALFRGEGSCLNTSCFRLYLIVRLHCSIVDVLMLVLSFD